ncbi:putative ammonium transporter 3-like protein [Dinothrombium tinctorium]|uniref:Putative ammonium transporter 3-like protein n=1 Tax=Dinothrombium tinctorium TaxID=1965070 RepID=A0A3S3NN95_9ACAR|nr:putative ammonium transporter 3-like protein [Dinothrombium tinctorium]RWS02756.1 putative ammonium transporter 3-like protein [Dinothrombium tinctorium]RWS02843.1 putative ammonium transporter 3-like protein [Dinothrombium tinctorium]
MAKKLSDEELEVNRENDICWILTSSFLTFTMQGGYALLESGVVSRKNEVNILFKNAINIVCGGLSFWIFGFALSFGSPSNQYFGYGDFLIDAPESIMGLKYAELMFHLAYSTTCTSIVSSSISERCKFTSFCVFCFLNTFVYSLPARWMLRKGGLLQNLGAVDIGASGTVHLVGGCTSLMAAIFLGPRIGRFEHGLKRIPMGNGTNALLGLFMLWWGWLGFSAGSSFGIYGEKWKYSSRASVTTIMATMGAGILGLTACWIFRKGIQDVRVLLDSILASLVAISGGAPVFHPLSSVIIGMTAAAVVLISIAIIDWFHIDDPLNSFAVHGIGGICGMIAIGLVAEKDENLEYTRGLEGFLISGRYDLLISQLIACVILMFWSICISSLLLFLIKITIGLRVTAEEELLGADFTDHALVHNGNEEIIHLISRKINVSKWLQKM